MSFYNIPQELQALPRWVVWKYVERDDNPKPTKPPFNARTGRLANITNPAECCTFEEAVAAYNAGGWDGIGLVLFKSDGYGVGDLDDTHGDSEALENQKKIAARLNSYTEFSPSGNGVHVIFKASFPKGRRRHFVELYSDERYITMTGNVLFNLPIAERQDEAMEIWNSLGAPPKESFTPVNQPAKQLDDDVLVTARNAENADKFNSLWEGNWQGEYGSQSEADQALINILAFYTQNKEQIVRLFRRSGLGQREKAQRTGYLNYTIEKAFDRQLPPVDIDGLRIKNEAAFGQTGGAAVLPDTSTAAPASSSVSVAKPTPERGEADDTVVFPPGLVGDIAKYVLASAPKPVPIIALATAYAFMAGITGRAYNVKNAGLNQYMVLVAATGAGKDIISSGISRLLQHLKENGVVAAEQFKGPGELVSSSGLMKVMLDTPSVISIIGEFGLKLGEMSSSSRNPHLQGVKRLLLQLYSKSAKGEVLDPMAYSDRTRNIPPIIAPSFSVIGECTPQSFYDTIDERMVAEGFLSRFLIMEYKGKVPYLAKNFAEARPSIHLVEQLSGLAADCLSKQTQNVVRNVRLDADAEAMFEAFGKETTDYINNSDRETIQQLWNRSHLKAMKLAALISVGINWIDPVMTKHEAAYAISQVKQQTEDLIAKFTEGDTGALLDRNPDEFKQTKELVKVIRQWLAPGNLDWMKYKQPKEMLADNVIAWNSVQTRLFSMPVFKNDRLGATNAIKRVTQYLIDSGEIQEVPVATVQQRYGRRIKAYVVLDPARLSNFA